MLYALLGESMWSGRLEVLGAPSGYYGLYPLLPGGLLRLLGPDHARLAALLIQSAIGCSTAIVTYLWARQVASARWSLGVAAAVLALPALNYSAFLMTESVSLLAVTSALFLLWRSFVHPSLTNQILAAGGVVLASQLRLQALVLVPAAILAVGIFGLAGRGRQAVREQGVLMSGLAALLVAGLIVGALNGSPLGGYSSVLDRPVPAAAALGWSIWHLGALAVMSALVPLAGAAALFLLTFLGKVEETRVQALVALTVAWTSVALVAAGGFVAQNVDHLKERNLSALVPPLLVCFAAWGARGLWSFRGVTVGCACFVGLMIAVMPERVLDFPASRVDAPSFVGLHIASEHVSGLAFRAALVAAIAACLLGSWLIARWTLAQRLPLPGLLVLPLALLTLMSVVAAREVQIASDRDREFFLGLWSSGLDRPPHREPDPPVRRGLVLLERLLASRLLESTRRRGACGRSGAGHVARPSRRAATRGRIDHEPARSTGSVARAGDVEFDHGRGHRARPTGAKGREQPAPSLGRRAAAPAPLPHPRSTARANVVRPLRDRRLRLPAKRPARPDPRIVGARDRPSHERRICSEGECGGRRTMDARLGRVTPRARRRDVCGALRARQHGRHRSDGQRRCDRPRGGRASGRSQANKRPTGVPIDRKRRGEVSEPLPVDDEPRRAAAPSWCLDAIPQGC